MGAAPGVDGERVRNMSILVRPHPQNLQPWHKYDFAEFDHVSAWPAGGDNPVDAGSKNDFYDSLFHSEMAVGVNTSAQIEAGIVGRPVFTIQTEEHVGTQDGTLHFKYLLEAGGGLEFIITDAIGLGVDARYLTFTQLYNSDNFDETLVSSDQIIRGAVSVTYRR